MSDKKRQLSRTKFKTNRITCSSLCFSSPCRSITVVWKLMPPLSFLRKVMLGGCLFKRSPKPSNSCSINLLCPSGFSTSRTINIKLQVLATAITCLPRPLPSFAPSMIPGRSSNWKIHLTFHTIYNIMVYLW